MYRINVQDRVQDRGIVSRGTARETVREITMAAVHKEMVQRDVRAGMEQKGVPPGMAREAVLIRIRVHVFRAAASAIAFKENVLVCGQGAAARETVHSGIVIRAETMAVSHMGEASVVPGVQVSTGRTEILFLRQW